MVAAQGGSELLVLRTGLGGLGVLFLLHPVLTVADFFSVMIGQYFSIESYIVSVLILIRTKEK